MSRSFPSLTTILGTCLFTAGCPPWPDTDDHEAAQLAFDTAQDAVDADGDGYSAGEDCDDGDATIHPAAD